MTKLFESKKIYNEESEQHEKITIYELTQEELTDCETFDRVLPVEA